MAELVGSGRGAAARPVFEPGPLIPLHRRSRVEAGIGDLVTVRLKGGGAEVLAVHGPVLSARAAMTALMADEGLGRGFPAAALREAEEAASAGDERDGARHDMTGRRVITIDPEGAKDHDDAIAVEPDGDGVRLWVHIADVSRYVPTGGALDREAARRGCSVYVPGTVDPMLPERLSTDVCSLRPGVPRRVLTAEIALSGTGEVRSTRFLRALIRSERRLTYPQVDALLAGRSLGDAGLDEDVLRAHRIAKVLRERRMARGALGIDSGEPVFTFHGDRLVDARMERQTDAHSLVEECMIAANEAVARHLIRTGTPTLFRTHEDPAGSAVERLYAQLERLGVATPPLREGVLTGQERREAARVAAAAVMRHVDLTGRGRRSLPVLVLRALRQAFYSPDDPAHSGLSSGAYLHFTSPIRRYPDLVVHRGLCHALGLGEAAPGHSAVAEAAVTSSEAERAAADVERRADRICLAYLLRDRLVGGEWDLVRTAEVTGVAPAGLFATFDDLFDGFLPARWLEGDHFRPDPLDVALVGDATGRRFAIGDTVEVRVADIEPLRGRVTLEPAERRTGAATARVATGRAPRHRGRRR